MKKLVCGNFLIEKNYRKVDGCVRKLVYGIFLMEKNVFQWMGVLVYVLRNKNLLQYMGG